MADNGLTPIVRFMDDTKKRLVRLEAKQGVKTQKATANNIVSDAIAVAFREVYLLVPETGTTDNLATIMGGTDGYFVTLSTQTVGHTITLQNGVGNLALNGDCILTAPTQTITLRYNRSAAKWLEISRSNTAATGYDPTISGLDFVVAYPTNLASVNQHQEWYSTNFGIVGGLAIDEGNNIIQMLDYIGQHGGGHVVLCSRNPSDPIYINKVCSIPWDNITLECRSPLVYGAGATLRVMGKFDEFSRTANAAGPSADVAAGGTVIPLSAVAGKMQASDFLLGDQVILRGQNDITGKAINKQITFVVAINVGTNSITIADELDFDLKVTYTPSDWNPGGSGDHATIYLGRYSSFTANVAENTIYAQVVDASLFSVGDYVKVSDSRNEHDMNPAAITGSGSFYVNPANLEIARIVSIDLATNTVWFDHALCFEYLTAYHGGIVRMLPVKNSHIIGARITYNADQVSKSVNSLQINFGVNCHIHNCEVQGEGGRRGQACRISYSYNCTGSKLRIQGAKFTGSGEGYGCTLYYTTMCTFHDCFSQGCRHNFLCQLATMCSIYNNFSVDDRISGIDCHGVRSCKLNIFGNHITRSGLHTVDTGDGLGFTGNGSGIRIGNTSHANGDMHIMIFGNYIAGYVDLSCSAMDFIGNSSYLTFQGNVIDDCYIGFRLTLNSSQVTPVQTCENIKLIGNTFSRCTNGAVMMTAAPTYDGTHSNGKLDKFSMIGNTSYGNAHHYELTGASGMTNVRIEDNKVIDPIATSGVYGLKLSNIVGCQVYHCTFDGCNRGISITNITGPLQVVGNILTNTIDGVAINDGGGNTSWFHEGNHGYDFPSASSGSTVYTHVAGSLSASQTITNTNAIPHDNSTPLITEGFQILANSYTPGAASRKVYIHVTVPYVEIATTGAAQLSLFAGSTCIGACTRRITTGGSSGSDMEIDGTFTTASTSALTIQVRMGPDTAGPTLTLNQKFGGLSQPYMDIFEYP